MALLRNHINNNNKVGGEYGTCHDNHRHGLLLSSSSSPPPPSSVKENETIRPALTGTKPPSMMNDEQPTEPAATYWVVVSSVWSSCVSTVMSSMPVLLWSTSWVHWLVPQFSSYSSLQLQQQEQQQQELQAAARTLLLPSHVAEGDSMGSGISSLREVLEAHLRNMLILLTRTLNQYHYHSTANATMLDATNVDNPCFSSSQQQQNDEFLMFHQHHHNDHNMNNNHHFSENLLSSRLLTEALEGIMANMTHFWYESLHHHLEQWAALAAASSSSSSATSSSGFGFGWVTWCSHLASEWPLLDWKMGLFVWRTLGGGLLLALALLSIVPGALHGWSGKVLRWPILAVTYLIITVELAVYVCIRCIIRIAEWAIAHPNHRQLRRAMAQAQSYEEWYTHATTLDQSQKRNVWLHDHCEEQPDSSRSSCSNNQHHQEPTHNYNWRFVKELMRELQAARQPESSSSSEHENTSTNNTKTMQSQIHRALAVIQQCTRGPNVGGIMSSDLFSYSNTGEPKRIVKDFLQEVITTLHWITEQTIRVQQQPMTTMTGKRRNHHTGGTLSPSVYPSMAPQAAPYPSSLPSFVVSAGTMGTVPPPSTPSSTAHDTLVLNVLKRSRAAYGRTALCLSGGATMGLYHFGVILGLARQGLLPRIISGTSAGSVVAAIVCTRTNDELHQVLQPKIVAQHMTCFDRTWTHRLWSLYQTGSMFDVQSWAEKIKWFTNGDMTFEEAYQRTGRIFCITLSSTTKKASPMLINHLSAPNVTIASAVMASSAVPGFIHPVRLQYKDAHGTIRGYGEHDQTYYDGSIRQDIPTSGLAEMLNCQFFIASQCNPHIVPFFFNPKGGVGRPSRWSSGEQEHSWRGGFLLAALEMYLKSKCVFLNDLEAAVGFTSTMMTQEFVGSTTIVPQVAFKDYFQLFSNPCPHDVKRYFQCGEVAAYEHAELIKLHYSIADALEDCIWKLEQSGISSSRPPSNLDTIRITSTTTTSEERDSLRTIIDAGHNPPRRSARCASFEENYNIASISSNGRCAPLDPIRRNNHNSTNAISTTTSQRQRQQDVQDKERRMSMPLSSVERLEQLVTEAIKVQKKGINRGGGGGDAIAFCALKDSRNQIQAFERNNTFPRQIPSCQGGSGENLAPGVATAITSTFDDCNDCVAVGLEQRVTEAIKVKKGTDGVDAITFGALSFDDDDDFIPLSICVDS